MIVEVDSAIEDFCVHRSEIHTQLVACRLDAPDSHRQFLNWAIDSAWTGGTTRLTVNTCTLDHPKALQIYQRAGFTPLRQDHLQILDPRLTGKTPKDLEPRRP